MHISSGIQWCNKQEMPTLNYHGLWEARDLIFEHKKYE